MTRITSIVNPHDGTLTVTFSGPVTANTAAPPDGNWTVLSTGDGTVPCTAQSQTNPTTVVIANEFNDSDLTSMSAAAGQLLVSATPALDYSASPWTVPFP